MVINVRLKVKPPLLHHKSSSPYQKTNFISFVVYHERRKFSHFPAYGFKTYVFKSKLHVMFVYQPIRAFMNPKSSTLFFGGEEEEEFNITLKFFLMTS